MFGRFGQTSWLVQLTPATLKKDLFAGLTGASIVLPQAVAFATIAGLPPEYGFYTAMVPPVVAALTGSSWHAVSGPTTAISILVFGALAGNLSPGSPEFIAAAISLTFMVGAIQLLLGLARLGLLINFVSHSVMVGFITGAAVLIGFGQLQHILGVTLPRPEYFGEFIWALGQNILDVDRTTVITGVLTLAVGIGIRHWLPSWPNYLIALIAGTVFSAVMMRSGHVLPVVGSVNPALPSPEWPSMDRTVVSNYGAAALAIALVGLLEALSVARAIALRSDQPIDGNREVIGQGAANLVGSFFQCYPSSASFTRSGVNFDSGAKTPLAAIFAAVFLLIILQFVSPLFALVPIAAMGGLILLVAWRLIDFREIRHIATTSKSEAFIALATFLTTLLINLEFSIYVGVLLSIVFFIRRAARPFVTIGAPDPSTPRRMFRDAREHGLEECPQIMVTALDGPLFFGSVETLRKTFRKLEQERPQQRHMLLVVKGVGEIDMPGADLLIEEALRRRARGGAFHLLTRTPRMISRLARFKVMRVLTRQNIHLSKGDALAEMVPHVDPAVCATCEVRIFRECADQAQGM